MLVILGAVVMVVQVAVAVLAQMAQGSVVLQDQPTMDKIAYLVAEVVMEGQTQAEEEVGHTRELTGLAAPV
jgi:hypothetical protein